MANKRTRERHLAKLAARRQAERAAYVHRRNRTIAVVVGVLTALVVGGIGLAITGGGTKANGTPTTTPSTSSTPKPSKPGKKTGTVVPTVTPPKQVACGGSAPTAAGKPKPQFTQPAMTIDQNATYTADIVTSCGTIVVRLLPKVAPAGVNSFVFLAKKGFYDGITFHRIVSGFVIQGGDPKGDGSGGPGYHFNIETSPKVTFDAAGLLAYANGGPGTNGSQFFITLDKLPQLNPTSQASYTIFGKVISGTDAVNRIAKVPTKTGTGCASAQEACSPQQAVYIESITIHEKSTKQSPSPSPSP